jgi:hypothetical protein
MTQLANDSGVNQTIDKSNQQTQNYLDYLGKICKSQPNQKAMMKRQILPKLVISDCPPTIMAQGELSLINDINES